jgi:murein DD-endopeptidase
MYDSPLLAAQSIQNTKKKSRKKLLFLALIASLGLGSSLFFNQTPGQAEQTEIASVDDPSEEIIGETIEQLDETALEEEIPEPVVSPVNQLVKTSIQRSLSGKGIFAINTEVHTSLTHTVCDEIKDSTECKILAANLARLLTWFLDVNSSPRKGDNVSLLYEKPNGIESIKILKLTYESTLFDKTFHANFYKAKGMKYGAYYDQKGREIAPRIIGKEAPIRDYIEITALPGEMRKGRRLGHTGSDFKADVGTPVFSSFEGRVLRTQWNIRNNGYCIEIDHPSAGVMTRYLHMSYVYVKRGEYVKAGQKIGESGNTGRTFAPHLHFELLTRGKRKKILNPFDFKAIKTEHRELPAKELATYKQKILDLDAS